MVSPPPRPLCGFRNGWSLNSSKMCIRDRFENDVYDAIDLIKCCEGRTSYGGPSEASVRKQIELASAQLGAWEAENA